MPPPSPELLMVEAQSVHGGPLEQFVVVQSWLPPLFAMFLVKVLPVTWRVELLPTQTPPPASAWFFTTWSLPRIRWGPAALPCPLRRKPPPATSCSVHGLATHAT